MSRRLPLVAQTLDFTCGAACFESMYRYLRGEISPDEMKFARELGTLDAGMTPVENVVAVAQRYGFDAVLRGDADFAELERRVAEGDVVFVTWWDEDAGHYSLVQSLAENEIVLMDPWEAREGRDKRLPVHEFLPLWRQRGARYISVRKGA